MGVPGKIFCGDALPPIVWPLLGRETITLATLEVASQALTTGQSLMTLSTAFLSHSLSFSLFNTFSYSLLWLFSSSLLSPSLFSLPLFSFSPANPTHNYQNSKFCTLRIRYNISTGDYPWDLDSRYNGANSPVQQDPYIAPFDGRPLRLAINTNQYGRTFQDRSYTFEIRSRPSSVADSEKACVW